MLKNTVKIKLQNLLNKNNKEKLFTIVLKYHKK